MSQRTRLTAVLVLVAALAAVGWIFRERLTGAPQIAGSDENWSASVSSPGRFSPHPNKESLDLPASRSELEAFLSVSGAASYSTGPETTLSPPSPSHASPCERTAEAVTFVYPIEEGAFQPRYVAYISGDEVVCIDRQFSYLAPAPF